jgi:hypothetical protein
MKPIFLAGLLLLAQASAAPAQSPIDFQTAVQAAQEQDQLLLLDFFTDW